MTHRIQASIWEDPNVATDVLFNVTGADTLDEAIAAATSYAAANARHEVTIDGQAADAWEPFGYTIGVTA